MVGWDASGRVVLGPVVLGPVVLGPVVLGPVVLGPVVLGPLRACGTGLLDGCAAVPHRVQ
ncbi:MAG: hypothetical protein ACRDTX_09970 [Pseudonocardiaceae bacterium]